MRKANSSKFSFAVVGLLLLIFFEVAKIDAVQAEYSAFETIHETDGLIETAKELKIAYVAYSPLGHGWLVDDFPFKTPEDFPEGDFRLTSTSLLGHILSSLGFSRSLLMRIYL